MRGTLVALAVAGCVDVAPSYQCEVGDPNACIDIHGNQGHCELSGNCSFPDPSCGDQGFRYDPSAQAERAGICVLSANAPTATQPQLIGASHALMFEITTMPQMIVFDTGPDNATQFALHWLRGSCPSPNEVGTQMLACGGPTVRVVANADNAGPYCLVVTDDPSVPQAALVLRAFPSASGSPPTCLQ